MLNSLDIGASALDQFQQGMNVIGNNIANVGTVGYKSSSANFEDTLSETLQGGTGTPIQVGTGVTTSSTVTDFTQGNITQTGGPSDLAIDGNGYFEVKNAGTGALYLTRAGNFSVQNGYLVTADGMRVQGYNDAGLSTVGDIKVDSNGSTAQVKSFNFSNDGTLTVNLSDGTSITRGQVLLQNVASPQLLLKQGGNLYGNIAAAGPLTQLTVPGTNGTDSLRAGYLEQSNVDLASQFADLIEMQRGFQASARVVTTSDEVLQEIVNLKR